MGGDEQTPGKSIKLTLKPVESTPTSKREGVWNKYNRAAQSPEEMEADRRIFTQDWRTPRKPLGEATNKPVQLPGSWNSIKKKQKRTKGVIEPISVAAAPSSAKKLRTPVSTPTAIKEDVLSPASPPAEGPRKKVEVNWLKQMLVACNDGNDMVVTPMKPKAEAVAADQSMMCTLISEIDQLLDEDSVEESAITLNDVPEHAQSPLTSDDMMELVTPEKEVVGGVPQVMVTELAPQTDAADLPTARKLCLEDGSKPEALGSLSSRFPAAPQATCAVVLGVLLVWQFL